ncbi:unnamed protein product (macronuclear) [Paramecium tetraurelia]|uniref:DUF4200 domain-containing protein n=1 Tax=Paramecium tetraurelia TaxID=5888 RepID=A0C7E0_PARTE|nr:uncharacterized protein GSPATT00035837001 [Paramecium tetraurelia]CAK66707.1 unnamed protein product [Paramecium tetraurelia]|eukprot:XP_001434104.1 hypothetical protein (macronuclear) [Paramecium tetraurelia strain d4-2]
MTQLMDGGGSTFDLTAPVSLVQPKINVSKQPEQTINKGQKELQPQKTQTSNSKLPQLGNNQNASKSVNQKSSQPGHQQSPKSLSKVKKIELFRDALQQATTKLLPPGKKDKDKTQKPKPLQESQQQQIEEIKKEYEDLVQNHYKDLYAHIGNETIKKIVTALQNLESRPKIQGALERKEEQLNKQRLYKDRLLYEIKQMIIKSRRMDELLNDLAIQNDDTEVKESIEELMQKEQMQEEKMAKQAYEIAKLRDMFGKRRKLLLEVQKQCQITYDGLKIKYQQYEASSQSMMSRKKQLESLSKIVSKYRNEFQNQQNFFGASLKRGFDPMLEEILEDELSKCGDLQALEIVQQGEKKIIAIKEENEKKKKGEQKDKAKLAIENATQNINKQKNDIQQELEKKKQMFQKLRVVTSIASQEDMQKYKLNMDLDQQELKNIQEYVGKEIERYERQNEELRAEIKKLKYEQENSILDAQINLDEQEREVTKQQDLLQEKEKSVKKVEKSIDEVTMSLSRIMYQLSGKGLKPKNIEIKRHALVATASTIQLRLERMLTVLSKTQEFLNEESINTNPRYNKVEDFICLNPKSYISQEINENGETNIKFVYKEEDSSDEDCKDMDEVRQQVKSRAQEDKPSVVVPPKKDKKPK